MSNIYCSFIYILLYRCHKKSFARSISIFAMKTAATVSVFSVKSTLQVGQTSVLAILHVDTGKQMITVTVLVRR